MSLQQHNIPPVYDECSKILILGSFPSVASRAGQFFYHHKQNRFWAVLAAVVQQPVPVSVPEKKDFLHRAGIALWDVIASCEITGSSDSSIRQVTVNPVGQILSACPIQAIFCNGATAAALYRRYLLANTKRAAQQLPSTSPAHASWSLARLTEAWQTAIGPILFAEKPAI